MKISNENTMVISRAGGWRGLWILRFSFQTYPVEERAGDHGRPSNGILLALQKLQGLLLCLKERHSRNDSRVLRYESRISIVQYFVI